MNAQGLVDGFYSGSGNLTAVLGAGYEDNPTYLAGKNELELEKSFYNINVFAAYGILDKLEINAAAAYVQSDQERALQDARVILKYKFYELKTKNYQLSTQIASGLFFPLTDYETEGLNAIGQHATSIASRLLIHVQHDSGFFATIQSGYDYKFDPVPSAIAGTLKLGLAKRSYYIDVFLDVQNAIEGKDYRGFPAPNNFRELEVDFLRVGATFYKPITPSFGAFVNGALTLDGRNVGLGPAVNVGLVFRTKL